MMTVSFRLTIGLEYLDQVVEHVFLWVRVTPEHGQLWEDVVDLLGHGHVGQQHELLDQLVAVTVFVQLVALQTARL